MVNSSEHGLARVVHHKDYYLRGGDMTVMVENHLYRIHSHFFERESLFFRQKFQSAEGEERGSSDNNAYTLDDVKSEDFSRFLWVFYNPKYSLYDAPLETWLSILHLANRWGFGNVKELTVRELEKMEIDPIEKIAIYHEYTINRLFLLSSYVAVCKRDKPLTFAEGMRLGMETVLRIADARERARQRAAESGIRTPTFHDFEDDEMESMVREVFGIASRPTSPPTSPAPQTTHSFSYSNGSTHTGSAKVNGSTGHKVNGSTSGRTNGTSATDSTARSSGRTNGTSIPEAARSSVDTMRSFATAMEPSSSSASSTTVPSSKAESKPAAQVPENKPPPPEKSSATSPDQANGGSATTPADASKASPWNKPNGTGEPSSVEGTKGSKDSSQALDSSTTVVTPTVEPVVSTPVVVKSNDESEHKDQETDAEKDETKDPELNGVLSDAEGSTRGGRGGNRGKGQGQQRSERGGRGGSGKGKNSK